MAGDWIKMRADLFTHPKVFRISELLGKDELYTVGALFCFWAWADKHCVDGLVDGATSRLIDRATRVDGLSEALIAVGWLEIDNAGAHIPRFGEHNGDTAKERSLKNQRQARWRAGKTLAGVDGEASTSASTKASTREEKRREDISSTDVEEKQTKRSKSAVAKPDGVADSVWQDFLAIRKAKRSPITTTALDGIQREANKAGMSMADVLAMCCSRGWQGFKADWVAASSGQAQAETVYQRSMRERMAEVVPSIARKAPGAVVNPVNFFETIDVAPTQALALEVHQ